MIDAERVVLLDVRIARATIRAMGYQAFNTYRDRRGETIGYSDDAFERLLEEEGLTREAVARLIAGV